MVNSYSVYLDPIASQNTLGHQIGHGRHITIITDTLQSAMSIARANCKSGEEVTSVLLSERDVIVDYTVCKGPN